MWGLCNGLSYRLSRATIVQRQPCLGLYVWDDEAADFRIVRSGGAQNGFIVKTAVPAEFGDGDAPAQLEAFAIAVAQRTKIGTDLEAAEPSVTFTNLNSEHLHITFRDDRVGLRKINDQTVHYYGTWLRLHNPWMHQEENSATLVLPHGDERRVYNFDAMTVAIDIANRE